MTKIEEIAEALKLLERDLVIVSIRMSPLVYQQLRAEAVEAPPGPPRLFAVPCEVDRTLAPGDWRAKWSDGTETGPT